MRRAAWVSTESGRRSRAVSAVDASTPASSARMVAAMSKVSTRLASFRASSLLRTMASWLSASTSSAAARTLTERGCSSST